MKGSLKLPIKGHAGQQAPSGKSWFLGIGIDQYREFSRLNNAVRDVTVIRDLLMKKYDVDPHDLPLLTNKRATREGIIDQLDRLAKQVEREDKLIIYYSGHGHLDKQTGLAYWIPYDARQDRTAYYILNSTIRDFIKAIPARHTLLISDACFSGSMFVRGGQISAFADELERQISRWAICSGRHDEEVYDGLPGEHSPFAQSIIKVLSNNTAAKMNVAKLADRVIELTRANYEQMPEGSPLFGVGHEGGQYVFRIRLLVGWRWGGGGSLGRLQT